MRNSWIRGGLIVLALVAVVGLVFVASHKSESIEQSGVVALPAAPAPTPSPQVAVQPVVAAPAAPALAAAPAPAPKAQGQARTAPAIFPVPMGEEAVRRVPKSAPSAALPVSALPEGEEPLPVDGGAAIPESGPIQSLTVVVSELPLAGQPSQEVLHRVRAHKEPVVITPTPGADTDQNLQDVSDPSTPASGLIGAEDTEAPIDPGSPAVAFISWDNALTDGVPFDVDMAVGTTHIVTDVNTRFKTYNKLGTLTSGPTSYLSFWSGLANCGAGETGTDFLADPQISYDDENNRWVMLTLRAQVTSAGAPVTSQLCLAASQTSDPTGAWYKYQINDGAGLADYPHIGIGSDAIFIGINHFGTGGSFDNASVYAVQKAAAYAGTAITPSKKSATSNYFTPQPAERRGFAQGHYPPLTTPHMFVLQSQTNGDARVWRWSYPTFDGAATFTDWGLLQAFGGTPPDMVGTNITSVTIDGGDSRPMDVELRWPYLWYTRGGIATQGSVMWAGANVSGGSPAVYQSGEYSDANRSFHWADCTVDKNQNFAVGFTGTNNATTVFPSAYITGREEGITAANTLEAYRTSRAGEVRYVPPSYDSVAPCRWGDYAGLTIDPNGCDIWFHGQYTSNTGAGNPQTRTYVQKYKFPSCIAGDTRQAFLDKSWYYCIDSVSAQIIDTGGAPTNAVYHCSGGATVSGVISGTGPYTVTPTSITALSGVDTNTVWLSFTGSDALPYNSGTAAIDCTSQVCVYRIDPISGGCDSDTYPDQGEVVNVNVALANYEAYGLPGAIQADFQLVGSDPNLTIVNGTATYPALEANTYAYSTVPFSIRYTGALSNCEVPLNFQIVNIRAVNNAWASSGCTAGTNLFSTLANADDTPGTAILTESFDGATYPPTGWSQTQVTLTGLTARVTTGSTGGPASVTVNPHSGAGEVYWDSFDFAATTAARLVTPSLDLSAQTKVGAYFWMFHSGTYTNADTIAIQASDNGTTWTTLGTFTRNIPTTTTWLQHTADLVGFTGAGHTTVRVGFLFTSMYGLNMFFDDVTVVPVAQICETTVCTPAPVLAYDSFAFDDAGCNNNTYLDPGEVGVLSLYLANTGNDWAYGTTATLTCPTCPAGVTICDNSATYGSIPSGTAYVYAPTSNTFSVAIAASVPCKTTLPFVVTANATNPYGPVAISAPVLVGGPLMYLPTVNNHTYEEHFLLDPGTAGASGRGGFTTAWTESAATRTILSLEASACTGNDGDGSNCGFNNVAAITHLFSTVGIDDDLLISWEWDKARQPTTGGFYLDYTVNGTTFTRLVSDPGTSSNTVPDWACWSGSMYASVLPAEQCYGAGCVLGNPNFGLRIGILANNTITNPDGYFDNLILDGYSIQCTTTTCTGLCPAAAGPPPVPNNGDVAGTPFIPVRNGSNVDMTWDATTCTAGNYVAFWGNLNTLSMNAGVTNGTVTSANCSLGTTGSATNQTSPTPAAGECYFVVLTSVQGTEFGRHGNNTGGNERVFTGETTACPTLTAKNITSTTCPGFAAGFASAPEFSSSDAPSMKAAGKPRQPVHKVCGTTATEPVNTGTFPLGTGSR